MIAIPTRIPVIAAFEEPRFQNNPIKNEGASCEIITNDIKPIEYKDSSLEKETLAKVFS